METLFRNVNQNKILSERKKKYYTYITEQFQNSSSAFQRIKQRIVILSSYDMMSTERQ